MDILGWILFFAAAGTLFLSYLRAQAVEAKVNRVLREFQKLSLDLEDLKKAVQGSVDELRKEIQDKLTYKK